MPRLVVPSLLLAQVALGHGVELLVVRHDQVGVAADLEPRAVDALGGQRVDLGQQHPGVDDDAVADHRGDVVVEDAARDQLEGEGLAVDHDGVAGVVAALVADDQVHLLGEEVGELPLALVTPLGADDHGRGHAFSSGKAWRSGQHTPAGQATRLMGAEDTGRTTTTTLGRRRVEPRAACGFSL